METLWKIDEISLCPKCMETLVLQTQELGYTFSQTFGKLMENRAQRSAPKNAEATFSLEEFNEEDLKYLISLHICATKLKKPTLAIETEKEEPIAKRPPRKKKEPKKEETEETEE
jgi:hypothetical protein